MMLSNFVYDNTRIARQTIFLRRTLSTKELKDRKPLSLLMGAWEFLDVDEIPSMSVNDLADALRERGLESTGNKKVVPAC